MKNSTLIRFAVPLVGAHTLLAACNIIRSKNEPTPEPAVEADAGTRSGDAGAGDAGAIQASPAPNLQWKRYAALEADIARALELKPEELCNELGRASCIREVHLVPLGGHEPFETGLLSPSTEPLATTPAAVDRVLLSACSQRVLADEAAGQEDAKVFDTFNLAKSAPAADSEAASAMIVELYRRFLSRNPDPHEIPLVASLVEDEQGERRSGRDFAILSCFAIGTTTEFLFF